MQNAIETIKTLTYGTELEYTHISRERAAKAIHSVVGGTVSAELLEVTPEVLAQMDVLEGYPNFYRQELVLAETPAGMTDALVYVMNDLPQNAVPIPSGSWRLYRKESSRY